MNFRGISRWLLGLAQLLAVQHCADGFSLSNLFSALTGQPLTISTTNAAQNFEGWGTSLAWCGEYLGSLESSQLDIVADMLFDPDTGLGLEIVRYNIGGSNTSQAATNSMRPFAAVPSMVLADGSYNWTLGQQQATVMIAARDRGALLFEAFVNSPPWFMTISGDPSGNVKGADNLAGSSYDAYVDYLTEVVAFYRDEANITFSTIEPFNEPSSTAWFQGNNQEGCHYDVTTQRAVLQKLAAALDAKGLSVETSISASDEPDYGKAVETFLQYGSALNVISQLNTHSYPEAVEQLAQFPLQTFAAAAGKRLWMSEYASGNYDVADIRTGLDLSTQIMGDLEVGKVQAWVYWQAVENIDGPGAKWGLLQMPFSNYNPANVPIQVSKQYYAMMQYSKFIKNGWTILDTSTDASTLAAMYQPQNSNMELAVVTTNTDTSSTKTNWDFGSMPEQIAVEVYRTSASENFTQLADVLLPISGLLQYDLPAQSITTFYFTVEADTTAPASATAG